MVRSTEWNRVGRKKRQIPTATDKPKIPKQHFKNKKTSHHDDDDYWKEISFKCVDSETLRIQEKMLRQAKIHLEHLSVSDSAKVHIALENVHMLAVRVEMLKGK